MPLLIKDRAIVEDRWLLLRDVDDVAIAPGSNVIVPCAAWVERRDTYLRGEGEGPTGARLGRVGVWLAPNDDPAVLKDDVARLPVIAIDFPKFTDGRGYSIARLLRERYGYRGELRAVGEVLRDQLFYLSRCGFNAFAVQDQGRLDEALMALSDFSVAYQSAVDRPYPPFHARSEARAANAL